MVLGFSSGLGMASGTSPLAISSSVSIIRQQIITINNDDAFLRFLQGLLFKLIHGNAFAIIIWNLDHFGVAFWPSSHPLGRELFEWLLPVIHHGVEEFRDTSSLRATDENETTNK